MPQIPATAVNPVAAMRAEPGRPWYFARSAPAALPWLIRLRWATAAVEAAAVAIAIAAPWVDFPLRRLLWPLLLNGGAEAAAAIWLSRGRPMPRGLSAVWLASDVVLLAGLLELTGGPFNPFAVIFAVHVTLAAVALGTPYATFLGTIVTASIGLLLYWHSRDAVGAHHDLNDLPTHLLTLWVAFTAFAELATHFVVQASHALARREQQIEDMRRREARTEHMMSLATLTAGAAHELSTPLATIALAARELEHAAAQRGTVPDLAEDARLIRTEVDRCRSILDQMSGRAGGMVAGDPEPIELPSLAAGLRARLSAEEAARLQVLVSPERPSPVILPRDGLSQAVLSLVRNAFDASRVNPASPVVVNVVRAADRLRVTVRDEGEGMPADVLKRAGEPFFTTKEPGRGLGLGLFLARVFAERLGGELAIESEKGTTVRLELPVDATPEALT
jgi:two-component system sensor histidine kinase RegB